MIYAKFKMAALRDARLVLGGTRRRTIPPVLAILTDSRRSRAGSAFTRTPLDQQADVFVIPSLATRIVWPPWKQCPPDCRPLCRRPGLSDMPPMAETDM